MNQTWHASPALLRAYADETCGPSDAWSLEAHLVSCPACRAELALALSPHDDQHLREQRASLLLDLPAQPDAAAHGRMRSWLHWVVRPAAMVCVVVMVLVATVVDVVVSGLYGGPPGTVPLPGTGRGSVAMLWLLAPLMPVAGVAVATASEADPAREAVLATPTAGLRLLLWHSATIVTVAAVLTSLAGAVLTLAGMGGGWQVRWLLPAIAITSATLALGSVLSIERAAVAVGVAWLVLILGPSILAHGVLDAWRYLLVAEVPAVLSGRGQAVWAFVLVLALVLLVRRRSAFTQLHTGWGH